MATWRERPLTSARMLGTGAGILALAVPLSLWFVVAGPTAGDRLVAGAFLLGSLVLGLYSLWEAKAPDASARSGDDGDGT